MKFSKLQAFNFGWQKTKTNFLFFVVILIVVSAISYIPQILSNILEDSGLRVTSGVITLLGYILQLIVTLGLIKISLDFYDDLKSKVSDLFSQYHLIFKFFLAGLVYTLFVGLGFLLFIIPGIYISIRLYFFDYFIVDKKMGPLESLTESWKLTKGSFWNLALFLLLLILLNILGALVFLVGLLVTIPVSILASVFVYRKLLFKLNEV